MELLDLLYEELIEVNNNKVLKCTCSNFVIGYDQDGIETCQSCGFIMINNSDISTEENETFVSGSNRMNNNNIEKASLGTNICGSSYLSRINSWGIWMNNYKEKTFLDLIDVIKTHCQNKIPKIIIDNTISCMKEINNIKHLTGNNKGNFVIIRGLNKKSLIAASVYYSSKLTNYPLTTIEISKLFNINTKDLTKGEKIFDKLVSKEFKKKTLISHKKEIKQFVERYTKILNFTKIQKNKCIDICQNLIRIEQNLIKGSPSLQAIACIYLCSKYMEIPITKKQIYESVSVYSDTILNKVYKSIMKFQNILCDNDVTDEWIRTSEMIREQKQRLV